MWQSIISIDKKYEKEYNYIIEKLNQLNNLAYAVENTKSRHHINIATNEEYVAIIKPKIEKMIIDTILVYIKYDYLIGKIHFNKDNYLNSTLLSALVYCDRAHEEAIVELAMRDLYEYSIDALFRFRMRELKSNWDEIVSLVNSLVHSNHTPQDIYSLIEFILEMSEGRKSKILITKENEEVVIKNITKDQIVAIPKLSDTKYSNIISAIISTNPYEIQLEQEVLGSEVLTIINNIVSLKTI